MWYLVTAALGKEDRWELCLNSSLWTQYPESLQLINFLVNSGTKMKHAHRGTSAKSADFLKH